MIKFLFLIPIAYLYATFLEWAIHKYILHGAGKNKNSFFSFHWHDHHKNARQDYFYDSDYKISNMFNSTVKKEIFSLLLLIVLHLPVYFLSPLFFSVLVLCAVRYFYIHRKSHLNVYWGTEHTPWHYDHHMGKNQDANWGVTTDFWDIIFKTKKNMG